MKKKFFTTRNVSGTAILGALSALLYIFIKFPLPQLFPAFLDIQFSELPCLIAGFAYGPVFGCIALLIRGLIKLPMTSTYGIGELGDLIMGLPVILVSSLIYRKNKSKNTARIGLILGLLSGLLFAILVNRFILIPSYIQIYFKGNFNALVKVCSVIKGINADNFYLYYCLFAVIPFNFIRYVLVYILTIFLYKRIKYLLDKIK